MKLLDLFSGIGGFHQGFTQAGYTFDWVGFSDDHNKYGVIDGKVVEMSDTQRYKQAGNAVTVDVVEAVARIIKQKELI
jgi:site-specific DNA-cytosine methylase